MARKIDIGSVAGIDEAIRFLKNEMSEKAIQAKLDKAFGELLDKAANVANGVYFGKAFADVVSAKYPTYTLRATSENGDLAFIEFGVGWGVNAKNEFANAPGAPEVHVGSWSKANEGLFWKSNLRYWYYDKTRYTGHEEEFLARPGMEAARQYVADNWERVVKEVFRFD